MTLPLAGVRVLDFTRLLPGPLATQHLADLGADVLKLEDPTRGGDYLRAMPPMRHRLSVAYPLLNRNKRGEEVAFSTPEGQQRVHQLVADADVLVESFRPGQMAQWGLGYEALSRVNPRLVYCAITGYGHTGPYAQRAGHDLNFVALSGVLDQAGRAGGPPALVNFQLGDLVGGTLSATVAILAALLQRAHTGQGQFLDVAMLDGLLAHAVMPLTTLQAFGQTMPRGHDILTGAMPFYDVYETADGRWFSVGCVEFKFWRVFCELMHLPHLVPQHIVVGEDAQCVRAEVAAAFRAQPFAHWQQVFAQADCCVEPVLTLEEALKHPQVQARQVARPVQHPTEGSFQVFGPAFMGPQFPFRAHW
jgi:crotonobetainyl-CoA:carnitine CoA-transferase CaiB-like acyl-CoA transferase